MWTMRNNDVTSKNECADFFFLINMLKFIFERKKLSLTIFCLSCLHLPFLHKKIIQKNL